MKLLESTVGDVLRANARERPDQEAFVFVANEWRRTWAQLAQEVDRIAHGLLQLGLRPLDHVAIWATNVPEWLLTQLASARIGCPLITINPEWKAGELAYALKQANCKLLVLTEGFSKRSGSKEFRYDYVETLRTAAPEYFVSEDQPVRAVLIGDRREPGLLPWSALTNAEDHPSFERAASQVSPQSVALIQFTSGTTGFPKGAMLTHRGILNNAQAGASNMRLEPQDRLCGPVPFYHCFGSILVNMVGLVSKATVIIPAALFDAHATLTAVEREKCTALHGVPTMFFGEIDDPDRGAHNLRSLRTGIMAGAPCPVELMDHVMNDLGAREMTIGYGLTEASPLTHQTLVDDPVSVRVNSVGRPIPGTQSKIVDPSTLKELADDAIGEIWVKGYHVMLGYYQKSDETKQAIVDGWLRTGDLGYRDSKGNYHISGRLKELIIVGGHNVYPAEIEQSIASLFPKDIEMVQVVGINHPKLQEVVGAAIQLLAGSEITESDIIRTCKETMEWPKVPRKIVFVDGYESAMTVTGKIQKHKIKDWFND